MADTLVRDGSESDPRASDGSSGGKHRLYEPGGRGGLLEVFRYRGILLLLVRRDVRMKYRYSSIGFGWAYVKPIIQFCIYYFVVGIVLDIERRVPNFAVYIFSGLALLSFFNESLQQGSRSVIKNRAIVKKIWLPRETFPIAGLLVAATRLVPMMIVLMVGATATGWKPSLVGMGAAVLGLAIIATLGAGLGLLLSAVTVYVREVANFLEFLAFITHWTVPMLKPWYLVPDRVNDLAIGPFISAIYLWNPLAAAVELFHLAFWSPTLASLPEPWVPDTTVIQPPYGPENLSPMLWERGWIMLGVSVLVLVVSQRIFARLQVKFAEEL